MNEYQRLGREIWELDLERSTFINKAKACLKASLVLAPSLPSAASELADDATDYFSEAIRLKYEIDTIQSKRKALPVDEQKEDFDF